MEEIIMSKKLYTFFLSALALVSFSNVSAVESGPQIVYETSGVITGFETFTSVFDIENTSSPYKATLTDFGVPNEFNSLTLFVNNSTTPMGAITLSGAGQDSFTFMAPSAGDFYAHIIGDTDGSGIYGVQIAMVPEAETWVMMILGVGLIGYVVNRRKISASSVSSDSSAVSAC